MKIYNTTTNKFVDITLISHGGIDVMREYAAGYYNYGKERYEMDADDVAWWSNYALTWDLVVAYEKLYKMPDAYYNETSDYDFNDTMNIKLKWITEHKDSLKGKEIV